MTMTTLTIKSASNPQYSNAAGTGINLTVQFNELPNPLPFHATPDDSMAYGVELYNNAKAGVYGVVAAYAAPVLTVPQQAAALLAGTVTVTSASTPSLNGTYTITATDQAHLQAEISSIMLNGTFADGTSTVEWPDTANPPVNHAFNVTQFKTFAIAIGSFVAACAKCINGVSTTLPSNQLSIS